MAGVAADDDTAAERRLLFSLFFSGRLSIPDVVAGKVTRSPMGELGWGGGIRGW